MKLVNTRFGLAAAALVAVTGLVQSNEVRAAEDESIAATTERSEREVTRGYLANEVVGIKPQAGLVVFNNSADNGDSRAAMGLVVEMDAVNTFYKGNKPLKHWYIGPSTGLLFSHLGNPSSNFFGTDPSGRQSVQGGSNFLMVPLNLKVGYLWPDSNLRFSMRAGGNITYRSVANALNFGNKTSNGTDSVWRMYPNIGADIEVGRLVIRPDLTLTPEDEFFSGTIGYNFALG
jgi:hypothetical protein